MGYPKQVYDRAWQALERRRREARELAEARRREVHRRIPQIAQLEREMAGAAAAVTKVIITEPDRAEELTQQLGRQNLALQRRRGELLAQAGYPADYLQQNYACSACRDSGYVGSRMCECLSGLLKSEAYARLSQVSPTKSCTFAGFTLEYYPDAPVDSSGVVPRARMRENLDYCMEYADSFGPGSESLLLMGHTGLGKTHLSLAIAAAATERGYGVVYTPVQKLMDILEAEKFSRGDREPDSGSARQLIDCDLLVLDDLGTEFATQFTSAMLYNIVNSRLVEGRPAIISTNLEIAEMEARYSQRMVSRLICGYTVLKFYGKDIRYIRKTRRGM